MSLSETKAIYLFAGKDHREIRNRVTSIENTVFPGSQGQNNLDIITFFAEDSDIGLVIAECETYPVFSSKKLIKLHNPEKYQKKDLITYLKNPSDSAVFIMISGKSEKELDKELIAAAREQGHTEFFTDKRDAEALAYLQGKLQESGISSDTDVLKYLVEQEECNTGNLNAVVEAIINFCGDGKPLTIRDIPDIIVSSKNPTVFQLIDTLFARDIKKSLRLYHQITVEQESDIFLLTMIFRQLKLTWTAKAFMTKGSSQSSLANVMGVAPFIAQKSAAQSKHFSFTHLEKLFHGLAQLDFNLKSADKVLHSTQ
ncbi:MAG: DNA polymerase III subunit delta, partial [Spirochaetota bacterium]|nr:DNA polymerase III subunit delta [Spirochaetota bacterium]